jgi:hypothetical protein
VFISRNKTRNLSAAIPRFRPDGLNLLFRRGPIRK